MRYVLTLQWPYTDITDFDHLVAFENLLESRLPRRLARVDGHDVGSGEMNIFVFTDKPQKALDECRSLIRSSRIASGLFAAYRDRERDEYTRLWPVGSTDPFAVK
jgi:hypothetical protein